MIEFPFTISERFLKAHRFSLATFLFFFEGDRDSVVTMYHAFVRRVVGSAFESLSDGDYETLLSRCAANVEHRFPGKHALGGARHSVQAMRRWFQRLFMLFPGLNFEIKQILVRGWPWDTGVAVEWVDRATTL